MKPGVLLMDMQEHCLNLPSSPARDMLVPSQLEVLSYCAQNDVPVIVIEFCNKPNKTLPVLFDRVLSAPRNRLVQKYGVDAFYDAELNLDNLLVQLEIDYLLLMGVSASKCVRATASSALDLGYRIGTAVDLIAEYLSVKNNGFFMSDETVNYYRRSGDIFRTHKSVLKHLEMLRTQ